jgi:competence protein ComFC
MYTILQHIIDYLFPPTKEEVRIRSIPIDWLNMNCKKALQTEFPFIKAVFSYKDPLIKELIWQIKYKKNAHAIACGAYALYSELNKYKYTLTLIPIPISKERRKERGYNQCELIIDEILKLDRENIFIKDYNILTREKDIEKQNHKNRNERISNTKHIFKVNMKNDVNDLNQKIIIIDDVTTTGSTLKEARDELLRVGYTDVRALTIAH